MKMLAWLCLVTIPPFRLFAIGPGGTPRARRCRYSHRHSTGLSGLSNAMSLFDLKCLESGQYVVWTLYYDQQAWDVPRDNGPPGLASERLPKENERPAMFRPTVWHNTESGIQAVLDILSKEVLQFEPSSKLTTAKELCVFDGSSLHSHTGKVWALQGVESCIGYLEKNSSPEAVLKLLGKKRRAQQCGWRQCLCCLTCLWLCNPQCMDVVIE